MTATFLIATLTILGAEPKAAPAERALSYLAREVPAWSKENSCYSCHNNGDAARALFMAVKQGRRMPEAALADTTRWLTQPDKWDKNGGDEAASDKGLARIQFASTLIAASDAGLVKDGKPLDRAAELVAEYQQKDGSWRIEAEGNVGSPATYCSVLASGVARNILHRADPVKFKEAIGRADGWLRRFEVKRVLDAAGLLLALDGANDAKARAQQDRCLDIIRKGAHNDGGWGPFVSSAPEPFDTAVVLVALQPYKNEAAWKPLIAAGRRYLIATQKEDGSWPETTRPANAESYAQRLSTAGWATRALLLAE